MLLKKPEALTSLMKNVRGVFVGVDKWEEGLHSYNLDLWAVARAAQCEAERPLLRTSWTQPGGPLQAV